MTVTGRRPGARTATNTRSAPGVSVPVTIASHSCSWTRISVARNMPDTDHFSPNAIVSLRVDRTSDDREERLLEGHGSDGRHHCPLFLSAAQRDAEAIRDFFQPHLR